MPYSSQWIKVTMVSTLLSCSWAALGAQHTPRVPQRARAKRAAAESVVTPPSWLMQEYIKELEKAKTGTADHNRKMILANEIPGAELIHEKGRYLTHQQKIDGFVSIYNGGANGPIGRVFLAGGINAYDLSGADQLSLIAATTNRFGPSSMLGIKYSKMINTEGTKLFFNYQNTDANQPASAITNGAFRLTGNGNSYQLGASQPLITSQKQSLRMFFLFGYNAGLGSFRAIPASNTNLNVNQHKPYAMTGVAWAKSDGVGMVHFSGTLTKGMNLPGLRRKYSVVNGVNNVNSFVTPDLKFFTIGLQAGQTFKLSNPWSAALNVAGQINPGNGHLPIGNKMVYGDGGYFGIANFGDQGISTRGSLSYRIQSATLQEYRMVVTTFAGMGWLKNRAVNTLGYRNTHPSDVGLGLTGVIPGPKLLVSLAIAHPWGGNRSGVSGLRGLFRLSRAFR
jgi:hemolysin activation/secretion protein